MKAGRWRQTEELESIADKVAQNTELMERFRSAFGSGDRDQVDAVMHEICLYAQRFDPTVGVLEGTRLAFMLAQKLYQPRGPEVTA